MFNLRNWFLKGKEDVKDKQQWCIKDKTYVVDEVNEIKNNDQESSEEHSDEYYLNTDIDYHKSESYNKSDNHELQAYYIQQVNYIS